MAYMAMIYITGLVAKATPTKLEHDAMTAVRLMQALIVPFAATVNTNIATAYATFAVLLVRN